MITAKILLYTYQKPIDGKYPIKIRFTNGKLKKSKYYNTGYYAKKWDGSPNASHPQYYNLMTDFLEWNRKINDLVPLANREQWKLEKLLIQFKDYNDGFDVYKFIDSINVKDRTKQAYITAIKSFDDFHANINSYDVNKWLNELKVSNNSKNVYIRSMKSLFNKAIKQGYINGKNPFVGLKVAYTKTANTGLVKDDIIKIADSKLDSQYKDYYLLMFYLGGILPIDLANLRYDKHVINGRIEFNRFKTQNGMFVSNKIFPQSQDILNKYDCYPYLVPIYKMSYTSFTSNFARRFPEYCEDLELTRRPIPKSARSSFANIAKNLLIDRRITEDIMGHSRNDTHSIYEGEFTDAVRDEAHYKIIKLKEEQ